MIRNNFRLILLLWPFMIHIYDSIVTKGIEEARIEYPSEDYRHFWHAYDYITFRWSFQLLLLLIQKCLFT